jgi:excisionase family DNA binding protein
MDKLGLSITEAAELIGIGRSHLYQQIRDGKGPEIIHIGRRGVISRKALEAWFRNLSIQQRNARSR